MQFVCGDHWEFLGNEKGDPDNEGCPFCNIETADKEHQDEIKTLEAERDRLTEEVERLHDELSDAWDDGYAVGRLNNYNKTPLYPIERKGVFVLAAIERAAGE